MLNKPSDHESSFTVEDAIAIRSRFLALGLFNIVLGVTTITLPMSTDYPVEVIVGLALMITGAANYWHAMLLRSKRGYILSGMSSFMFFLSGGILVISWAVDLMSLHMGFSLLFFLGGMFRVIKGLEIRRINSWPCVVASGVLSCIFGLFILYQGEAMVLELISLVVGISLIVDGWSRMIVFWVHEQNPTSDI